MSNRKDAIGQELKVNECAYVISKSSIAGGAIGLITKLNPKTVQINGVNTIEDDRVLIVTQNMIDMGKQQRVDSIRQQYENVVDFTDPNANPKKLPIRFVLLEDKAGNQHLLRFEGDSPSDAHAAVDCHPDVKAIAKPYSCKVMSRQRVWRTQEKYLAMGNYSGFFKECIFALRTLPDNLARHVTESSSHVIIPPHDHQPLRQDIPKK